VARSVRYASRTPSSEIRVLMRPKARLIAESEEPIQPVVSMRF